MQHRKFYVGLSLVAAVGLVTFGRLSKEAVGPSIVELSSPTLPVHQPLPLTGAKKVTSVSIPQDRIVEIYGEINEGSESAAQQILTLAQTGQPVYIAIDSPGGSVLSGATIVSAMEAASSKAQIVTICTKLCASMAAVILSYGTSRWVFDRSLVMFHPASGGARGEVDKMASELTFIKRYVDKMEAYIASRAGISFQEFKSLTSSELWLDGEDAVARKFADKLVSANIKSAPRLLFFSFTPTPDENKHPKIDLTWSAVEP